MIYKCFYKREARAENYDNSHCYASCDPKTENQKCQPISQKICGYYGSNELAPDEVQYRGNLVETVKVWSIQSILSPFSSIPVSGPRQHQNQQQKLSYSYILGRLHTYMLRGNMCVACDRRSGTSKISKILACSFLMFWWSKSNLLWYHRPECNDIYGILTELWHNMEPRIRVSG